MKKIWNIKNQRHQKEQLYISNELGISPILAQLLINRGIKNPKDAHNFLFGNISSIYDPFLLKGMKKAVLRIRKAALSKERVMIYGDYDVDGVTSCALLKIVLRELGIESVTYIPNRIEEGYGLNLKAVKYAKAKGIELIITVDCGIDAIREVKLANTFGIDVVITDHHEIKKDDMPPAYAIINPHQKGCEYPFKYLAGVGIAYKLSQALMKKRYYHLEEHLDLVALGTVADIAPQISENRIFTKHGLSKLNETKKTGLKSLIKQTGLSGKNISSSHIGYILGPRINAMGRIGSADVALKLLLAEDKIEADKLAGILNNENKNRQKIEAAILEEAILKLEREINFKEHCVIVLAEEGWHAGVVGIVASRIQDRYYRPTIVIALNGDKGKGSGRSIDNFNLFNAMIDSKEHLLNFGGHEAACGLSIHKKNIDKFRKKINQYAWENIDGDDLFPKLDVDMNIDLSVLTLDVINELEMLKPYGPENPRPLFSSHGVMMRNDPRFIGKKGFKMLVNQENATCETVSFRRDTFDIPRQGQVLDIAYTPSLNSWQGIDSIQLDLKDLRIKSDNLAEVETRQP